MVASRGIQVSPTCCDAATQTEILRESARVWDWNPWHDPPDWELDLLSSAEETEEEVTDQRESIEDDDDWLNDWDEVNDQHRQTGRDSTQTGRKLWIPIREVGKCDLPKWMLEEEVKEEVQAEEIDKDEEELLKTTHQLDESKADKNKEKANEKEDVDEQKADEKIDEEETDVSDDDYERVWIDDWDYDLDPNYKGELHPSLPCKNKRGVSYTPPGWRRKYKYVKVLKPTAKKRLDCLLEL